MRNLTKGASVSMMGQPIRHIETGRVHATADCNGLIFFMLRVHSDKATTVSTSGKRLGLDLS